MALVAQQAPPMRSGKGSRKQRPKKMGPMRDGSTRSLSVFTNPESGALLARDTEMTISMYDDDHRAIASNTSASDVNLHGNDEENDNDVMDGESWELPAFHFQSAYTPIDEEMQQASEDNALNSTHNHTNIREVGREQNKPISANFEMSLNNKGVKTRETVSTKQDQNFNNDISLIKKQGGLNVDSAKNNERKAGTYEFRFLQGSVGHLEGEGDIGDLEKRDNSLPRPVKRNNVQGSESPAPINSHKDNIGEPYYKQLGNNDALPTRLDFSSPSKQKTSSENKYNTLTNTDRSKDLPKNNASVTLSNSMPSLVEQNKPLGGSKVTQVATVSTHTAEADNTVQKGLVSQLVTGIFNDMPLSGRSISSSSLASNGADKEKNNVSVTIGAGNPTTKPASTDNVYELREHQQNTAKNADTHIYEMIHLVDAPGNERHAAVGSQANAKIQRSSLHLSLENQKQVTEKNNSMLQARPTGNKIIIENNIPPHFDHHDDLRRAAITSVNTANKVLAEEKVENIYDEISMTASSNRVPPDHGRSNITHGHHATPMTTAAPLAAKAKTDLDQQQQEQRSQLPYGSEGQQVNDSTPNTHSGQTLTAPRFVSALHRHSPVIDIVVSSDKLNTLGEPSPSQKRTEAVLNVNKLPAPSRPQAADEWNNRPTYGKKSTGSSFNESTVDKKLSQHDYDYQRSHQFAVSKANQLEQKPDGAFVIYKSDIQLKDDEDTVELKQISSRHSSYRTTQNETDSKLRSRHQLPQHHHQPRHRRSTSAGSSSSSSSSGSSSSSPDDTLPPFDKPTFQSYLPQSLQRGRDDEIYFSDVVTAKDRAVANIDNRLLQPHYKEQKTATPVSGYSKKDASNSPLTMRGRDASAQYNGNREITWPHDDGYKQNNHYGRGNRKPNDHRNKYNATNSSASDVDDWPPVDIEERNGDAYDRNPHLRKQQGQYYDARGDSNTFRPIDFDALNGSSRPNQREGYGGDENEPYGSQRFNIAERNRFDNGGGYSSDRYLNRPADFSNTTPTRNSYWDRNGDERAAYPLSAQGQSQGQGQGLDYKRRFGSMPNQLNNAHFDQVRPMRDNDQTVFGSVEIMPQSVDPELQSASKKKDIYHISVKLHSLNIPQLATKPTNENSSPSQAYNPPGLTNGRPDLQTDPTLSKNSLKPLDYPPRSQARNLHNEQQQQQQPLHLRPDIAYATAPRQPHDNQPRRAPYRTPDGAEYLTYPRNYHDDNLLEPSHRRPDESYPTTQHGSGLVHPPHHNTITRPLSPPYYNENVRPKSPYFEVPVVVDTIPKQYYARPTSPYPYRPSNNLSYPAKNDSLHPNNAVGHYPAPPSPFGNDVTIYPAERPMRSEQYPKQLTNKPTSSQPTNSKQNGQSDVANGHHKNNKKNKNQPIGKNIISIALTDDDDDTRPRNMSAWPQSDSEYIVTSFKPSSNYKKPASKQPPLTSAQEPMYIMPIDHTMTMDYVHPEQPHELQELQQLQQLQQEPTQYHTVSDQKNLKPPKAQKHSNNSGNLPLVDRGGKMLIKNGFDAISKPQVVDMVDDVSSDADSEELAMNGANSNGNVFDGLYYEKRENPLYSSENDSSPEEFVERVVLPTNSKKKQQALENKKQAKKDAKTETGKVRLREQETQTVDKKAKLKQTQTDEEKQTQTDSFRPKHFKQVQTDSIPRHSVKKKPIKNNSFNRIGEIDNYVFLISLLHDKNNVISLLISIITVHCGYK